MAVEGRLHTLLVDEAAPDADLASAERQQRDTEFPWVKIDLEPALDDRAPTRYSDAITGAWDHVLKEQSAQLPVGIRGLLTRKRALVDAAIASEALRASERRYRTLLDSGSALIWTSDPDGKRDDINQPWLTFTGRTPEQELGDGWRDGVHPDDLGRCLDVHAASRNGRDSFTVTYRLRRHDGEYRSIQEQGTPRYDTREAFLGHIGHCLDVTEVLRADQDRRRLEAGLVQAQKMEAVGRLAGGVSHDLNNLLTGILGYCDLLLASMPSDSPHRADVVQIQAVAERASPLTRQLHAFIRKQTFPHVLLNLTALVSDLRKPLRTVVRENIELVWELAPDLADIEGDPGQIEQALYNLVVNASDAMPEGGRLTVRTAQATLDDQDLAARLGIRTGRHVTLSVADTGGGIEPQALPHVFEPAFAAMAPGEGSGLALAAVRAIVQQCGGGVAAASDAGRGATYTMYFPVPGGAIAACPRPADTPCDANPLRTGTILIVEDDEVLRPLFRRALEGYGYTVVEAADGRDAIARWRDASRPIDLLLTDVVMPGQSGPELARAIREAAPALPVVFMSGYADPDSFSGMTLDDRTSIIQKPCLPHALAARVRQLLDRRPRGQAMTRP